MNIVIAPDSYKGSLPAPQAAQIIAEGFTAVLPEVDIQLVPMADGGEGTLPALVSATNGKRVSCRVRHPLGGFVTAAYGVLGNGRTVVIEMAEAAGITLIPPQQRNPLRTSTFGVGQLMQAALDQGYRDFIVGLGGSATNDGGLGLLMALGVKCHDATGQLVEPTGFGMTRVQQVDISGLDTRIPESNIRLASDVDNPLTGENGSSAVFGPQKGADAEMIRALDSGLARFAACLEAALQCQGLAQQAGSGAAGGLGFGLLAVGAKMVSGARLVAEACDLERRVQAADLVITGEGRSDAQTLHGKVPFYVATLARKYGKPVILLSGSYDAASAGLQACFTSVHAAVCGPVTLEAAMQNAHVYLRSVAANVAALVQCWGRT